MLRKYLLSIFAGLLFSLGSLSLVWGSSSSSSQAKEDLGTQSVAASSQSAAPQVVYPYSQTMGFLKAQLQDPFWGDRFVAIDPQNLSEGIKTNIFQLYNTSQLNDHIGIRTDRNHPNLLPILDALLEEHKAMDRDFAYHGASPQVGVLYDIYTEFRRQLMGIKREDLFLARGTDQAFAGLHTVADFVQEQQRKQNKPFKALCNYGADYAEKALSVNLFLFGNYGAAFDDTIKFFMDGEADRNVTLTRSLLNFFTYFGLDVTDTASINALIQEFESLPLLDRGRLFQFSFAPGTIDEFIYLSESVGRGVNTDGSTDYDMSKKLTSDLLKNIKQVPLKVKEFSETVHHCEGAYPKKHFSLKEIQGRFLPYPHLFAEDSPLKVHSYWRGLSVSDPKILDYRNNLKGLVSKVVALSLGSKVVLPKATLLTDPSNMIARQNESNTTQVSEHLRSAYICAGDLDQVQRVLGTADESEINRPIIDIADLEDHTPHPPLYLGVKYHHPEVVAWLLSKGARVDNDASKGRSLMGWACMNGYPDVVQKLLDAGCNPNATFRGRLMPEPIILVAQEYGQDQVVEKLINHRTFVPTDEICKKLLTDFIENQKITFLNVLLQKVQNVIKSFSRFFGWGNFFDLAKKTGNQDIIKALNQHQEFVSQHRS